MCAAGRQHLSFIPSLSHCLATLHKPESHSKLAKRKCKGCNAGPMRADNLKRHQKQCAAWLALVASAMKDTASAKKVSPRQPTPVAMTP